MKIVETEDVRSWYAGSSALADSVRSIGRKKMDPNYLEQRIGMPYHLCFVLEKLLDEQEGTVHADALDSIPFYSLCRGLFLPLAGLAPDRAAALFGIVVAAAPDSTARQELLQNFFAREIGLSPLEKISCILGDPFQGRRGTFRRDSLVRLLMSVQLVQRQDLLHRLARVGDIAVLFAENRPAIRQTPQLTAREVLETLAHLPGTRRNVQFGVVRSLLERTGKLEAYFLAKLILRKAGFGLEYQGPMLARLLAGHFHADEHQVAHAILLTDAFHVIRVLTEDGPDALKSIQIKPLVPLRPALAGGLADEVKKFPVWVERKYDGIRLMLHKSTDTLGSVLCGAYTRNRHDWLELVPGLDMTIKLLPARNVILDGELFGTLVDVDRVRPASVYELHSSLQGNAATRPVSPRFAAFDLVYLDGVDLTGLPLSERRRRLSLLLAPLPALPLPVPMSLAEGQLVAGKDDLNRLYHHFRAQGYEGIVAKEPGSSYRMGERDPAWMKRKPEITLDLVLFGAVLAVTTKESAGMFGSYVIGARTAGGTFEDVGDVAGVDRVRDAEIQAEILREGLLTGRKIERPSASGARPGFELRPDIVVTVKFEGVVRDVVTHKLSLRDPKLAVIRADKSAFEADSIEAMERLFLDQRLG